MNVFSSGCTLVCQQQIITFPSNLEYHLSPLEYRHCRRGACFSRISLINWTISYQKKLNIFRNSIKTWRLFYPLFTILVISSFFCSGHPNPEEIAHTIAKRNGFHSAGKVGTRSKFRLPGIYKSTFPSLSDTLIDSPTLPRGRHVIANLCYASLCP